jgi:site-specific DNA-cytosine methylase
MPKTKIFINNKTITIKEYLEENLLNDYNFSINYVNTKDYGIPQLRNRVIVLGTLKEFNEWKLPNTSFNEVTVREAIGYLPSLESGEISEIKYHYAKKHMEEHILCMKHTPTGKTAFDNEIYYPKKINGDKIKGFKTIINNKDIYDVNDLRDFIFGSKNGGLTCSLPNGELVRVPYILPYIDIYNRLYRRYIYERYSYISHIRFLVVE